MSEISDYELNGMREPSGKIGEPSRRLLSQPTLRGRTKRKGQRPVLQGLFTPHHLAEGCVYVRLYCEGWMDPRMVLHVRRTLNHGLPGVNLGYLELLGGYDDATAHASRNLGSIG